MNPDVQAIYDRIRDVAKNRGVTYYSEIAPLAGLDLDSHADLNCLSQILGLISEDEHHEGRPLLSAVVVQKVGNEPGPGFFGLAQGLGLYNGGDATAFWVQELQRVHDYWSKQGATVG